MKKYNTVIDLFKIKHFSYDLWLRITVRDPINRKAYNAILGLSNITAIPNYSQSIAVSKFTVATFYAIKTKKRLVGYVDLYLIVFLFDLRIKWAVYISLFTASISIKI